MSTDHWAPNSIDELLTPEEQKVFALMSEEEIDAYLAAQESFEAMQTYVENPQTPVAVRALIDLSVWSAPV